jgi:zinc transporter ZupT
MTLLLGSYAIQLFEHTLAPHFHFGAKLTESFMKPSAAYTAVGGLWIHTFFDGVSVASAFLSTLGWSSCLYCDTSAQDAGRICCSFDYVGVGPIYRL